MKKIFFILGVVLSLSVVVATPVFAGPLTQGLKNLNEANKTTGLEKDLENTVGAVIKTVLAMVGTIFLGLTIYAGILWMTASGNDEQVTKATGIIKAAIIGLFITMSAYAITYFVTSKLGGNESPATNNSPGSGPGSTPITPNPGPFIDDCFKGLSLEGTAAEPQAGCLDAKYGCNPPEWGSDNPYSGDKIAQCSPTMDCCLFKDYD